MRRQPRVDASVSAIDPHTLASDELRSSVAALSARLLSKEGGSPTAGSATMNKGTNRHECLNPGVIRRYPRASALKRLRGPIANSLLIGIF